MDYYSDALCSCGCGERLGKINRKTYYKLKKGLTKGWKKHHKFRGQNNPNWNNRRASDGQGYMMLWKPEHPNANKNGWILEHRLVMSEALGRPLLRAEIVHHLNEDKLDNRIENLEITTMSEHAAHHGPPTRPRPTHCKRGHAFDEKNTYIDAKGAKICRTCKRLWWRNNCR